jgi:hypothetical protein
MTAGPDGGASWPTPPGVEAASAPRRADVLGIVGTILGAVVTIPSVGIFLIGLAPEWNPIWWLLLPAIPALAVTGVIALLLGLAGLITARQRGGRFAFSLVAVVLGAAMTVPILLLLDS